jgi:hypothetical protein
VADFIAYCGSGVFVAKRCLSPPGLALAEATPADKYTWR